MLVSGVLARSFCNWGSKKFLVKVLTSNASSFDMFVLFANNPNWPVLHCLYVSFLSAFSCKLLCLRDVFKMCDVSKMKCSRCTMFLRWSVEMCDVFTLKRSRCAMFLRWDVLGWTLLRCAIFLRCSVLRCARFTLSNVSLRCAMFLRCKVTMLEKNLWAFSVITLTLTLKLHLIVLKITFHTQCQRTEISSKKRQRLQTLKH